jgi:hypothetical protein
MSDLERRIATALEDETTSADLIVLLDETEAAIAAASTAAEAEREKALDPLLSPDPAQARAAMEDAAFTRDRLRAVLPRLEQRLTEVKAAEYAAIWEPEFQEVKVTRDELATELRELYPRLATQLADLFYRIEAADKEVSCINGSAPSGDHRRLLGVELTARNLASFSTARPSIMKELKLPHFDHSDRMVWPPPSTPLAVLASQAMPAPPHSGGDWWRGRDERAAAQRAEQARVAAYYEEQARQREEREEREAAEAQARRSRA